VLFNLTGIALSHSGRHEEAAAHFLRAEEVFDRIEDPVRVPMAKINRAFELLELIGPHPAEDDPRLTEARTLAADAINRGRALSDDGRNTVAYGLSAMARVAGAMGDLDEALIWSEEAEATAAAGGFDLLAVEIALDRAGWMTAGGRLLEGREVVDRLRATPHDHKRSQVRLAETEANLLEAEGDFPAALAAFRRFHTLEGELRTDSAEQRARLTATRFELENARRETDLARVRIAELEALDHHKRDFLASVSHELRTPLAAVFGFASELAEAWDKFEADEARGLVNLIARQSADISAIVEDLLTITRLEAGTMHVYTQTISIRHEVEGVVDSLSREGGRQVDWDGDGAAWADPTRLRQIVRNLLTNAFRYGGDKVRILVREGASSVTIEVRDSGGPIPSIRVNSIFEPFVHADDGGRTPNSVGLGLAVARSLAHLMGGDLIYEFDGESIFRLTLVAANQPLAMVPAFNAASPPPDAARDISALRDSGA
jgi:signal transduction histidine kinase